MKKLSAAIAALCGFALLCVAFAFCPKRLCDVKCLQSAEFTVFCRQTDSADAVSVGYGYIVPCGSASSIRKNVNGCGKIDGMSAKLDLSDRELDELLAELRFAQSSCRVYGDSKVLCGYSPLLCGGVTLDGEKINLQISVRGNTVVLGSPLIMESF